MIPRTDDYIGMILGQNNEELAKHLEADVIAIKSPIRFGLDDLVRQEVEPLQDKQDKQTKNPKPKKLVVILETTGGNIEVVERIYNVFRKHYALVDFIVPNYAYSAGTVLVLSGDQIYMDYYSVLGPIDPQYEVGDKFLPGMGYLQKFEQLRKKINEAKDPSKIRAEMTFLVQNFEPAILFLLEQAISHSESLLEEWLPKHKFKDWKKRKSSGAKVTDAYRKKRAREVAQILGNHERWHSHGRGIGIKELTSEEIKLQIVNFGDDPKLNKMVRSYYELFRDYCAKIGARSHGATVIHTRRGLRRAA